MPRKSKSKSKRRRNNTKRNRKSRGGCGCEKVLFHGGNKSRRYKGGMFSNAPMTAVNNPVVGFGTTVGAQTSVDIISGKSAENVPYNSIPIGQHPLV